MKTYLLVGMAAFALWACTPARAADDLIGMYQGYAADTQQALDQPHRSINELSDWLSDTVATSLVFTAGKNNQKLNELRPLFSDQGYKSYLEFLTGIGLTDALQKQALNLSTIVNNAPLLIGQGASAGRYAWAFEVPVVLTISAEGAAQPLSKNATLRIQFGRSAAGPKPHGILIESWKEFKETPAAADTSGQPAPTP